MQLGDQGSGGEAMAAQEAADFGTTASNSGEEEKARMQMDDGDRSFGGNRWPRQETLALLKIRSDMDAVFRDSNPKAPLWDEVSRKLAELGYHRSAKKCKEKFENVYKYHKRTKEGRTGRSESKTYKFFDQLQALEKLHSHQHSPPPNPQTPMPTTTATALPWTNAHVSATAVVPNINNMLKMTNINPTNSTIPSNSAINPTTINSVPSFFQNNVNHQSHNLFSTSASSSSTASEESGGSSKKKRKWKEFFKRLTKEVIEKQEELQRKFLEAVEKQENERTAREEAWRVQEMARINREHEVLVHERSTAAVKDAAVIAFLQKFTGQQNANNVNVYPLEKLPPSPYKTPPPQHLPQQQQMLQLQTPPPVKAVVAVQHNGGSNAAIPSPSRWPKAEVEALIKLRTSLDTKYQDGPKAPLWEEISAGMRRMGYNRNAKRCKEKWENINKYFKKVKESNKKRPEDSKTCPYFHQLDAIYREKGKTDISNMLPLMVQPEQQWPPREDENLNMDAMQEDEEDEDEDEDEGETDREEDEGGYEIVTNKITMSAGTAVGNTE